MAITEAIYLDIVERTERAVMGDRSVLTQIIGQDLVLLLEAYRDHQRMQTTALERVRQAWANYKSAVFQGDSEEAYALMEMDTLLGVNERGEPMGEPSLFQQP